MKRHWRKVVFGVGFLAFIAVVLVVILVFQFLRPTPPPPTGPTPPPTAPRADSQPADCPDVLVVSIPGTWESKANDDPYNPTANKNALLLRVTRELQRTFESSRAEVYTVPYVAQFRNPTVLGDRQEDYNVSRAQGKSRAEAKLRETNEYCPLTTYILMGFSQGAVIAGDIASEIGNGSGPISAQDQDLILGVGLIADGRRQAGQQNDVGPSPDGHGAEVALAPFGGLVPGIEMTGPRSGGFGTLADRTYSVCASGDLICDSPRVTNPISSLNKLASAAANPVHAMYATKKYWSANGASATQWLYGWAARLIQGAPHPKHS